MKQTGTVKIIKKNPCAYCDRAINLLKGKGYEIEIVDLTDNWDEILNWKAKTGWQTVPIIFINDTLIGGYNELKALDNDGKLDELLTKSL